MIDKPPTKFALMRKNREAAKAKRQAQQSLDNYRAWAEAAAETRARNEARGDAIKRVTHAAGGWPW